MLFKQRSSGPTNLANKEIVKTNTNNSTKQYQLITDQFAEFVTRSTVFDTVNRYPYSQQMQNIPITQPSG
jgi:hypothetical protein